MWNDGLGNGPISLPRSIEQQQLSLKIIAKVLPPWHRVNIHMNTSDQQTEKTSAFIESVTVNEPNNQVHWFGSYFSINSSGSGNGVLKVFIPHICISSSFCSKT